jgi:hypothetical protein
MLMNAICTIALLVLVPGFLLFILALCKSAAMADIKLESLRDASDIAGAYLYDRAKSDEEIKESPKELHPVGYKHIGVSS